MLPLPLRTCGACGSIARVRETTRISNVETNAHYRCENEKCERRFIVLTAPGKRTILAVIGVLVLLIVAAFTVGPSPDGSSLRPLGGLIAFGLVAAVAALIMQLRAEKANPVRE